MSEVMQEIENMKVQLKNMDDVTLRGDRARPGQQTSSSSQLPNPSNFENIDDAQQGKHDYFTEYEQQQQLGIIAEQNQQLDDVGLSVGRLREQANYVGIELGDQRNLLMDVEQATDRMGDKLKGGAKRLGDVLRANEGRDIWIHHTTGQTSLFTDTERKQMLRQVAVSPSSSSYSYSY